MKNYWSLRAFKMQKLQNCSLTEKNSQMLSELAPKMSQNFHFKPICDLLDLYSWIFFSAFLFLLIIFLFLIFNFFQFSWILYKSVNSNCGAKMVSTTCRHHFYFWIKKILGGYLKRHLPNSKIIWWVLYKKMV